jgi:hypothetical protein
MTRKLKSLFSSPGNIEARLTSAFEGRAAKVADVVPTQPFELIERAADDISRHAHPAGRSRVTFPYNSVTVTFAAPADEDRARFDAIAAGPPTFQERVVRRLRSAGCDLADADVDVAISFVDAPDPSWTHPFHVALAKVPSDARARRGVAIHIDVLVTHGTAQQGAFTFSTLPIAIGRGADVRDNRHQLLRINHVAFADGDDDINKSVSRRHARIELDPHTSRPRVIDDNSAQGTSIIRNGRGMAVPKGSRGLGLQSGDEVVLGQARIAIKIGH